MKKKLSFLLVLTIFLSSCNTAKKAEQTTTEITTTTTAKTTVTTTTVTTTTTTTAETTAVITTMAEITSDNGYIDLENDTENINSFASYLTVYTEKHEDPPYGVFVNDINEDGQDEMIMHTNPFDNLDILYMKDGELKVVECGVMSQWGGTWYDNVNNRIVNQYFYGHTEGTAGAYEYYVYDWNGEDYVMTMHLECEAGYFERESDGVTKTDNFINGQAYLNGEEISNEKFEELHAELKQYMTAENRFGIVESGAFETDKELAKEQWDIYNAYLAEKLYTPQMTYYEIEHPALIATTTSMTEKEEITTKSITRPTTTTSVTSYEQFCEGKC